MSDIMRPIPFDRLMSWALEQYHKTGALFGVSKLYHHQSGKALPIFDEKIETPFGPAAGPHTQLTQNLIAAYAAGSRFFELKTVQTLDGEDLPVDKPCIFAEDECYNVEWSTELRVADAMDEYIKAWVAIKLLAHELQLGAADSFVFNMSVGYDLKGIMSPKIDAFIEGLKDARGTKIFAACIDWALNNLDRFARVDRAFVESIEPRVCRSITLSTLHGCPPDEIERIARYLIDVKGLNTYVKCNPTLLGYDFARSTLDAMGYDYLSFDDHHFNNDLQYKDAVPMFERLIAISKGKGVEFGLKLTNTFPVRIERGELPGAEMYMSGKSLFPLSISLAQKIEKTFEGKLRVSYSGGADAFNIERIFDCGIWPITMATTLLKPGGYNRLCPMADALSGGEYRAFEGVDLSKLDALVASVLTDENHVKAVKFVPVVKKEGKSPLIDCFTTPCANACPIHQDIPTYLDLVGRGEYLRALEVICEKNPLPFITGTICAHRCMHGCARNFCEEPIAIRAAKLTAAQNGMEQYIKGVAASAARPERVAVLGGGPGGMAAAFFLARGGARVTIFEQRGALGGVVRHVIPAFRIEDEAVERDAALLRKLNVEILLNTKAPGMAELIQAGYTHVVAAVGAWKKGELRMEAGTAVNVLDFLEAQKADPARDLGACVVVIGGGNSAMDAARAARRAKGAPRVILAYRRTVREMPADAEELALAMEDGVEMRELLGPVSCAGGILRMEKMALGAPDASGRRSPQPTGAFEDIAADTVIAAVGEKVDGDFLAGYGVKLDARGRVEGLKHAKVYVVGDAKRGPATVVEAIADARDAANDILGEEVKDAPYEKASEQLKQRRGTLAKAACPTREHERCLGCPALCEMCVDVCPNRANIEVVVPGMHMPQVVHVDSMCNECGNCQVFCPYDSAPYKEKFTLFAAAEDLADSENQGFAPLGGEKVRVRLGAKVYDDALDAPQSPDALVRLMRAVLEGHSYAI